MGATIFSRMAYGKDAYEAYESACESAADGDGGGDSGDLNGFKLVEVPQGVKLRTWLNALEAGDLPQALQMHAEAFNRQSEIYDNKDEPVLCFEVIAKTEKGERKIYVFAGWVRD